MPAYNAAGVRVRLGSASLHDTITQNLKLRKHEAVPNSTTAEAKLRESRLLREKNVPFPGDNRGFRVNFLKNVPFLQVQAGGDLFSGDGEDGKDSGLEAGRERGNGDPDGDHNAPVTIWRRLAPDETTCKPTSKTQKNERRSSGKGSSSRRPSTRSGLSINEPPPAAIVMPTPSLEQPLPSPQKYVTDASAKALTLHVTLSEQSFLPSFDDGKQQHLLIDVFFNGMLSSSVLMVQRDITSGVKDWTQIFAGTRAHCLAERPWVISAPTNSEDSNSLSKDHNLDVRDRWDQISAALLEEADERGTDKYGDRSPTGSYLESLAIMEMPTAVLDMHSRGRTFGIIDIVITTGTGRKTDKGYLWEPTRLRDDRYIRRGLEEDPMEVDEEALEEDEHHTQLQAEESDVDMDADGDTDPEHELMRQASSDLPNFTPIPPLPPVPPFGLPAAYPPSMVTPASDPNDHTDFVSLKELDLSSNMPQDIVQHPSALGTPCPRPFPRGPALPFGMTSNVHHGLPIMSSGDLTSPTFLASSSDVPNQGMFGMAGSADAIAAEPSQPAGGRGQLFGIHGLPLPAPPLYIPPFQALQQRPLPIFPLLGPVVVNGPLPQLGMFKATSSVRPQLLSDLGNVDDDLPPSSFLVSRLLITTGEDLHVVVDHRWRVPQLVSSRRNKARNTKSYQKKRRMSDGDEEWTEPAKPRRSRARRITVADRLTTPPPTSPTGANLDKAAGLHEDKSQAACNVQPPRTYVKSPAQTTTSAFDVFLKAKRRVENAKGVEALQDDAAVTGTETAPPNFASGILGIQGTKANQYILDNPEELLRQQKKAARAAARNRDVSVDGKPSVSLPTSVALTVAAKDKTTKDEATNALLGASSGSSLSSAAPTPELEAQQEDLGTHEQPLHNGRAGVPRLDPYAIPADSFARPRTPPAPAPNAPLLSPTKVNLMHQKSPKVIFFPVGAKGTAKEIQSAMSQTKSGTYAEIKKREESRARKQAFDAELEKKVEARKQAQTEVQQLKEQGKQAVVEAKKQAQVEVCEMTPAQIKATRTTQNYPWPGNTNLSLNSNCSIQFAVENDLRDGDGDRERKEQEQEVRGKNAVKVDVKVKAPLRQIKSEKLGVFREDMVLVGMRYFIPG